MQYLRQKENHSKIVREEREGKSKWPREKERDRKRRSNTESKKSKTVKENHCSRHLEEREELRQNDGIASNERQGDRVFIEWKPKVTDEKRRREGSGLYS